jgi:hypothetical protein
MFMVIKNDLSVLFIGNSVFDCVNWVNSNPGAFMQADKVSIVQVVRTGTVSVTVTILP